MHTNRLIRRSTAVLAVSALAVAAGGSTANAKTIKNYKHVCNGKITGTNISTGKCTGSLGKSTFKITLALPKSTTVQKYKGGTITFTQTIAPKDGKLVGKWKVAKGTGKYKKAKGSGTSLSGQNPSTGLTTSTYKGKLSY